MAKYYPEITGSQTHMRMDGKLIRYLAPPQTSSNTRRKSAPVSHVFFPHYVPGQPGRLTSIAQSDTLGVLMQQCYAVRQRLTNHNVQRLLDWVSGIAAYDLTFSSLQTAADLICDAVHSDRR
jgi:hypothetical protein